jgi:hypothetical protein
VSRFQRPQVAPGIHAGQALSSKRSFSMVVRAAV